MRQSRRRRSQEGFFFFQGWGVGESHTHTHRHFWWALIQHYSIIHEVRRENESSAVIKAAWQLNPVMISTSGPEEGEIKGSCLRK